MASRRKGRENGEVVAEEDDQTERKRLRQHRKQSKMESDQQQRNSNGIRWALVIVLLTVAAAGLYFYLTNYQTELAAPSTTTSSKPVEREKTKRDRQAGSKGKDKMSADSKPTKTKSQKPAKSDTKARKRDDTEPRAKTSKPVDSKETNKKSYSTREGKAKVEEVNLNEVRLLRRPIGPVDPDKPYVIEILMGDNLLVEERWSVALEKFNEILKMFPQSPRALYGKGLALENLAMEKRSNKLMDTAIDFYSDASLKSFLVPNDVKVAALLRLAEVAQSRGKLPLSIQALEKVQEIATKDSSYAVPSYTNRLGLAYLTAGETKRAMNTFKDVVQQHPGNAFAKAHIGFVLFTKKKYDEALPMLLGGIRNDKSIRSNAKFYLYAGECLVQLNRSEEAFALYGEAVSLDLFPSLWQRSLYTEPGLRAKPWWSPDDVSYGDTLAQIQRSQDTIKSEVMPLLDGRGLFSGGSTHLVLFSKGKKMADSCRKLPKTCALIETLPEAVGCRRGIVQLVALPQGTHILPHTAPSNTKLQVVVGVVGGGVRIRVADESRSVDEGGLEIIDDSFETELWQLGSEVTIILQADVWHPDLTEEQTHRLVPI